ncbi:MAG: hypothetical protein J2P23_04835 [Microlunatus sp.]|nr:hypothetical protein [Microlunatus sp.]
MAAIAVPTHRLPMMIIGLGVVLGLVINSTPAYATYRPAVIGEQVIGHSVQGRPIKAWHLGQQGAGITTVVLIAQMHGDEQAPADILTSLRDGDPVNGVNLWVVPTYNPDGHANDARQNAHGVDLNRNYPASWAPATGMFDSGPRAASEPETRAMMAFLTQVDPDYVISFHQPLDGVDLLTKRPAFSRRLAAAMHLPSKDFACNSSCHGTLTMWFDRNFAGEAITVEYGLNPSRHYLRHQAVTRLLSVFGADRSFQDQFARELDHGWIRNGPPMARRSMM